MKYLDTVLENRRNAIKNMASIGMSVTDMARFFEMPPRTIQISIKNLGLNPDSISQKGIENIEQVLDARDKKIASQMEKTKDEREALAAFGFLWKPKARSLAKDTAENAYAGKDLSAQEKKLYKKISSFGLFWELLSVGLRPVEIAREFNVSEDTARRAKKDCRILWHFVSKSPGTCYRVFKVRLFCQYHSRSHRNGGA